MEEAHKNKKIELVFPESSLETESKFERKDKEGKLRAAQFAASIDDISSWFKRYHVNSIELWISGAIQTEEIVKLAVSAKGEGGLKLILTPNKKITKLITIKEAN